MDLSDPYKDDKKEEEKEEKKEPVEKKKKSKSTAESNIYDDLGDDEEEEDEEDKDLDEDDGEFEDDPVSWFKNIKVLAIIGVLVVGIIAFLVLVVFKEEPPPPPPPVEETPPDPVQTMKDELYKMGIGKDAINDLNIYDQGPIESGDFRKDFVNTDSAENYKLPVTIVAVNDSVSYTKHRTMTDDGMDMYWADALYKSKKTRFTIPYYIWQTLAPQGVMDVIVEVVTDADGKRFVGSITAVPPTKGD